MCYKHFISIPNKPHGFSFQRNPPQVKWTFPLLLCHTARRLLLAYPSTPWLWLSCWLSWSQNWSTWWLSWAWGKEKITQSKIEWLERLLFNINTPHGQQLSDALRRGEATAICPESTLVSSCTLSEAYTTGSPCRLADTSSVTRTLSRRCSSHWRVSKVGNCSLERPEGSLFNSYYTKV